MLYVPFSVSSAVVLSSSVWEQVKVFLSSPLVQPLKGYLLSCSSRNSKEYESPVSISTFETTLTDVIPDTVHLVSSPNKKSMIALTVTFFPVEI